MGSPLTSPPPMVAMLRILGVATFRKVSVNSGRSSPIRMLFSIWRGVHSPPILTPSGVDSMELRFSTFRSPITWDGCDRRCFIWITNAVPPAMIRQSSPYWSNSPNTWSRLVGA